MYKPLSYWRILLRSGGCTRQFSRLKIFRALLVPVGGYRKGLIFQGSQLPSGLPVIGHSCLIRKGDVTGASVHAPRLRNSTYVQMVRHYIYDTIRPDHPHSTIHHCKQRPQGPPPRPRYNLLFYRPSTYPLKLPKLVGLIILLCKYFIGTCKYSLVTLTSSSPPLTSILYYSYIRNIH